MASTLPVDFFGRVAYILQNYSASLGRGVLNTMIIAVLATLAGCVIGLAVGIVQTIPTDRRRAPVRWGLLGAVKILLSAYVEIFRGTPMMVQAMFIFYGVSMLTGVTMPYMTAALLIVSINTGAYMAETVRGGILSIDPGQTEGARAIGMTHVQTMVNVILPQALRNIMPQIGNNLIINIKDTCVLSCISVVELFFASKGVAGAYYWYFETYAVVMVIYFVLTFACSRLLRLIERRMDGPANFDLAVYDTSTGEAMPRFRKNPAQPNADYRAKHAYQTGNLNLDQNERGR
ncbi:MAG: amino acid ABC transporter permease [Ruthenibacterium sp.]|jgi:amino ABC transporter, permease protein, 3-TM region, his/glu/gln/arg/opine family